MTKMRGFVREKFAEVGRGQRFRNGNTDDTNAMFALLVQGK